MTKYESLPERYSNAISEEQYIRVLEIAQDYLIKFGEIIKVSDGLIEFNQRGELNTRFALDNLIRTLAGKDFRDWQTEIEDHFSRVLSEDEDRYDLDSFEAIRDILGVRVYADTYFGGIDISDQLIFQINFEETKSCLVFDYPNKFQLVFRENFEKWGISEEEAFSIAHDHASHYEVEITKHDFETFSQFSFFSSSHSVSYILNFNENASMCIGKAGSIVNIPTQGSAFAIPIDSPNVKEMIEEIGETIVKFFDEDPGNITANYYWYYNGKFTKFDATKTSNGYQTLTVPEQLVHILTNL
jgi:hypothetical protein